MGFPLLSPNNPLRYSADLAVLQKRLFRLDVWMTIS